MSGRRSSQKGYRGEREAVKFFEAAGFKAKRRPISGGGSESLADVIVERDGEHFEVEVKRRKDGWRNFYKWLEHADILYLRADRKEPLIVLTKEAFLKLCKS